MKDEILDLEKVHLRSVLDKLGYAYDVISERLETLGADNLEKLKDLRENPETSGADLSLFLEQLHQENLTFNVKDKYKRLEELNFLLEEPYFARIDLAEGDESNTVYIGKFGYTEKVPVITDWRAKVASVYYRYRYPQKNVKYMTPDGTVETDLLLKRTYEIDSGNLIKYFNNDLKLDESEIISSKIEKRTGGVLEDIVETIQEAQLDIIEADPRQVTIVQGCVGSGKSTVAIHKLSHIFFNHPDLVKPERAILIAKNQILVGYLSTLFPKLGIFDINYKTLRELLFNIVFREEMKIELDLDEGQDLLAFSLEDINNLNRELAKIHIKTEKELKAVFQTEDNEPFGGHQYSTNSTPYENVSEIINDLEEELSLQKDAYKENPKSIKAIFHKDNIAIIKKIITKLKKIRINLLKKDLVKFFKDYGIDTEEKLNYRDALIYVYAYLEIVGFTKFRKYDYCVIDEGQDFSLLEYLVLQKVIVHGRFCILGDLNQGYIEEGIASWDDISKVITEAKSAALFSLDTNYRSTKQIIDVANSVLSPYTKTYLPKSINRMGPEPEIKAYSGVEEELAAFKESLAKDLIDLDKTIGIISMDPANYVGIKNVLKDLLPDWGAFIELNPNEKISYLPKGVYLSSFENCKGLEFAKLYVLDLNLDKISNFTEAKRAFVSVTRAMNELDVYYVK